MVRVAMRPASFEDAVSSQLSFRRCPVIRRIALVSLLVMCASACVAPTAADPDGALPMKDRAALRDAWTRERLDSVVPSLMRREGIDLWVLVAREYDEDPVVQTMLPATWLSARRRTILVFHDRGDERPVERFAVARYAVGDLFESAWNKESQPDQWARLVELIVARDPARIGLNISPTFALADGLTASEHDAFLDALPAHLHGRIVGAEKLAIGWLETRLPAEVAFYEDLCARAHAIIAEGLSSAVITPGTTTTADVEWWFRDRIRELRMTTWFHPSVSVQRPSAGHDGSFADDPSATVIERGDLVHVDFGITDLALNTDTQQHAYVLRAGETEAPAGLRAALADGNRLQDILMDAFVTGRSGNEILSRALRQARDEGLRPTIYTHPLGLHGHGAGPTIGLWDQQGGVPGKGDYPLHPDTCHSIELMVTVAVPEWDGQDARIMLEEDAVFDGETCRFLDGRQEEFLLIR